MQQPNRNTLSQAVHLALLAGTTAGLAFTAGPVLAQGEDDSVQLDKVEITGTRLKRVDIEGANPVTILDRSDIKRSGHADLGDLIKALPSMTGSSLGSQRNNSGGPAVLADIRGLGANRTLVLINGRRVASALASGGTDLSAIPIALVERVEVLKDGASAIYGADAVAGVINVITRRDYEGAEFEAQYGESIDEGGGTVNASFITGGNSDRGNFVVGLEYTEVDEVFQGAFDEEYIRLAVGVYDFDEFAQFGYTGINQDLDGDGIIGIASFGSSRTPGGRFVVPSQNGGNPITLCQGNSGTSASDFGPLGAPCGPATYDFAPVNYMQTPQRQSNFFFQGDYELFDNVNAYAEARFSNRRSEQLLAPLPYDSRFDPKFDATNNIAISKDNVYNPFGEDVTEWRRRMLETGGRSFNQNVDQWQVIGGLSGDFGGTWTWDASYNFSRRDRADTDIGQFFGPNLQQALGPSFFQADGSAVCGDVGADGVAGTPDDNVIAGCVPLDAFGSLAITPQMLAFVAVPLNDRYTNTQQVFNATLVGDVLDLPAGPVGVAFGYEHRKEDFRFDPDSAKAAGVVTGNKGLGTVGNYDVDSFFIETAIPLLSGAPGAELLELNLSGRFDDFSNFGSTENFQAGFRWQPVRSVLVRGTFNEVFREPNMSELFAGQADSFPNAVDLCNTNNYGNLNATQQAECTRQGVPVGGSIQSDNQLRARVGGNENLNPEEGETVTLGVAWSPDFADGLSLTLDYWEIDLENAIQAPSANAVFARCFNLGIQSACNNITRFNDSTASINAVFTLTENVAKETASGWDFSASYSHNTDVGLWNYRLLSTLLDERIQDNGIQSIDAAGRFEHRGTFGGASSQATFPEWKHNFYVDWSRGNWSASASVEYLGSVDYCQEPNFGFALPCLDTTPTGPFTFTDFAGRTRTLTADQVEWEVDEVIYIDLVGRYTLPGVGSEITVGLTNVTDEELPFINQGFNATTDPDTYRAFGRSWYMNYTHSF